VSLPFFDQPTSLHEILTGQLNYLSVNAERFLTVSIIPTRKSI